MLALEESKPETIVPWIRSEPGANVKCYSDM